jgi:branched-subunit amino acid transport protein
MEPFINIGAFVVFAILCAAFATALVWSQGSLDQTWEWIRSLPLIVQGVVWLLFLPVVAGLWAWETTWPLVTRLLVVAGLGFANLYVFLPRSLLGGRV